MAHEKIGRLAALERAQLADERQIAVEDGLHETLSILADAQWHTNAIMAKVGAFCGRARMSLLRHAGKVAREWPVRLLFPPTCLGCRDLVTSPGTLCPECWPGIRFLERPWCPVMGTPFDHDMGPDFLSGEAIADPPPHSGARGRPWH